MADPEKPRQKSSTYVRCILVAQGEDIRIHAPYDKPLGVHYNAKPPPAEKDGHGNVIPSESSTPRPRTDEQIRKLALASLRPNFEPDDKQDLWVGFRSGQGISELHPDLALRLIIPPEDCPSEIHHSSLCGDGYISRIHLGASNVVGSTLTRYWDPQTDKPAFPAKRLPRALYSDKKFTGDIEHRLWKWDIKFDNSDDSIYQENVYNAISFDKDPRQGPGRAIRTMRKLFKHVRGSFTLYLVDDDHTNVETLVKDLLSAFQHEKDNGRVYRHFYTANLQVTNQMHHIDTGTSLKDPAHRPSITTLPQTSYASTFEQTTRLGVAVKQSMELTSAQVQKLNAGVVTVRIMEYPNAGDTKYWAILNPHENNIRLTPDTKLKLDFRLVDSVADELWDFVVCAPFSFSIQGEITGVLHRPKVPVAQADADGFRRMQTTKVPVLSPFRPSNIEDARRLVMQAKPIRCHVTLNLSARSESRIIQGLDLFANGYRPGEDPVLSESLRGWQKTLLMHDATPTSYEDILGDEGATVFADWQDEDHRKCTEYARRVPCINGKVIGVQNGAAGCGKTQYTSNLVTGIKKGWPDSKILLLGPSNAAVDVLAEATQKSIKSQGLSYEVIRAYAASTESSYLINAQLAQYDKNADAIRADLAAREDANFEAQLESADGVSHYEIPDGDDASPHIRAVITLLLQRHQDPQQWDENTFNGIFNTLRELHYVDDALDYIEKNEDLSFSEEGLLIKYEPIENFWTTLYYAYISPMVGKWTEDLRVAQKLQAELENNPHTEDGFIPPEEPKMTKGQKKAAKLQEARLNAHYNKDDFENAVTLTEDELSGEGNKLTFTSTQPDGTVPVPADASPFLASLVNTLNAQIVPTFTGVHDKRFTLPHLATASAVLKMLDSGDHPDIATAYARLKTEGKGIAKEDLKSVQSGIKSSLLEAKSTAKILALTVNSVGDPSNYRQLQGVDDVIFDEASLITLAEFMLVLANVNPRRIWLVGDVNQLSPIVPHAHPLGCVKELGESALGYFTKNNWPGCELYLQRRGAPGIATLYSTVFYKGVVQDAPCTRETGRHPHTETVLKIMKKEFPEITSDLPIRCFEIDSTQEIRDSVTGSYSNLESASFFSNLTEVLVKNGIKLEDMTFVSHYTGQLRVYDHVFAKLREKSPHLPYEIFNPGTSDSMQGSQNAICNSDPVRVTSTGFTNDRGRCLVMLSRSRDFSIIVACTSKMVEGRTVHLMRQVFDAARKLKICITVKKDGHHGHWLQHPFVTPQVFETEDNIDAKADRDANELSGEGDYGGTIVSAKDPEPVQGDADGKDWPNHGAADGKDWPDHGDADGKDWPNHGAADGKDWPDHGDADGKDWPNHGAADGKDWPDHGDADGNIPESSKGSGEEITTSSGDGRDD